uniref:Uncharacterized protein n=1 Tax=Ditylum brightwellii TaxID=49249 RepID=A0A7S4R141_9STRA
MHDAIMMQYGDNETTQRTEKNLSLAQKVKEVNNVLKNNPIWTALCASSTSNSWSLLSALVTKVNQKLARDSSSSLNLKKSIVTVDLESLAALLDTIGKEILKAHGIWYHSFGPKYQPILAINPVYGRARLVEAMEAISKAESISSSPISAPSSGSKLLEVMIHLPTVCTCHRYCSRGKSNNNKRVKEIDDAERGIAERKSKRYFNSLDYNAGRHGETTSKHHASCAAWNPPSSGHLHSWRRGYNVA